MHGRAPDGAAHLEVLPRLLARGGHAVHAWLVRLAVEAADGLREEGLAARGLVHVVQLRAGLLDGGLVGAWVATSRGASE